MSLYDSHASSPQEEAKRLKELFDEHHEVGYKKGERFGLIVGFLVGAFVIGVVWFVRANYFYR